MKLVQNIIFPTLELLKKRNKQRGLTLLLLLLFQSILDILSVTSFIPLAYLLINPSLIMQSKLVVNLLQYSPSVSLDQIKLFLPALIAIFFIFKHWTIVFIARYRAQYSFSIAGTLSTEIMKRFLTQPYTSFYEKK